MMEELVGLRVTISLRDADPVQPRVWFALPSKPLRGTISGWYVGRHQRIYYYVTLNVVLELDTSARAVRVAGDDSNGTGQATRYRCTELLHVFNSDDKVKPPADTFGPELLRSGRALASGVSLIFRHDFPGELSQLEIQQDDKRPYTERTYVYIGYGEVELVDDLKST